LLERFAKHLVGLEEIADELTERGEAELRFAEFLVRGKGRWNVGHELSPR